MTPAHASPEQVRGDVITTASDIYVLGVLMYELLCGKRPFHLVGTSLTDMERIICEQEALPPSAMVARVTAESPELMADLASQRSTTAARLQKQLRGDLDNIIGMAMRKDPSVAMRPRSNSPRIVEHHLNGQPVLATSDTWLYRTRKFINRHALAVTAGAVMVITLAAFSAVTLHPGADGLHRNATSRPPSARARSRSRRSWSSCSSCLIHRGVAAIR